MDVTEERDGRRTGRTSVHTLSVPVPDVCCCDEDNCCEGRCRHRQGGSGESRRGSHDFVEWETDVEWRPVGVLEGELIGKAVPEWAPYPNGAF